MERLANPNTFDDFINWLGIDMSPSERTDGDYDGEDGLLYCGKCNTPKQYRLKAEPTFIVRTLCRCEKEKRIKERERQREETIRFTVQRMKNENGLPRKYKESSVDKIEDEKLQTILRRYHKSFFEKSYSNGRGLLLWGGQGVGKTYASAALINLFNEHQIPAIFTNLYDIVGRMDSMPFGHSTDALDELADDYKIIVIDDFGRERNTAYMDEKVFQIINYFVSNNICVVYTTNLTPGEIENYPVGSRIIGSTYSYECVGGDRRLSERIDL